jgi:flagellar hook-associated protein 2
MSRIQSSVGLITGIPIQDTVNKLMALATQPRTLLSNRTRQLEAEKLAVAQLTSLLVAFQFEATQLGSVSLFESRTVTSSNSDALSASLGTGGTPAVGTYLFTPVQTASTQQFLSQSFAADQLLGAGSFTFGPGGFVDQGISLDELNSGAGVRRGKIRITDRSGESAVIDLSFARTVDDVLQAINDNTDVSVSAAAAGDSFKLIDTSGGAGNLRVQEVSSGFTAADLGLAGINVAANEATGSDVLTLHAGTSLSLLNDGNGVQLRAGNELTITFADESSINVDLEDAETLGDVLDALNAASPAKLSAAIAADGNRLELSDLTAGAGEFAVESVGGGTAAEDLGLTAAASGDTITGGRLASGLRDTLVSSLQGGQGLGTLGQIDITNRNNVTSNVDLSAAETLGEIIEAINDQAVGVTAAVNAARNGILLTDTTGATTSNFIVADGDANDSATALGIVFNGAATTVNSGALRRQQIGEATLLSSLRGGAGIDVGDFIVTDSQGATGAVDLDKTGDVATTVGDVIDRINALAGVGVEARINDNGDGIVLVDTAGGTGTLSVAEVGSGTTAKDLRILGEAEEVDIEGTPTQVIDGTATTTVTIGAEDTLADLVEAINELDRGLTASLVNDGNGQRLSLSSDQSGAAGVLLLDATGSPLSLAEVSAGRDALLLYGTSGTGGALISSSTNVFGNVVDGLNVTVNAGTLSPVTVSVSASSAAVVSAAHEFVAAYNSYRDTLDDATAFNEEDLTTGILFGTTAALRVETTLANALTGRFSGVGEFTSLEAIGISLDGEGQMELDEEKLKQAFATNPAALKTLFTDETLGVSAKLEAVLEQLAAEKDSVLSIRTETLSDIIETNTERITAMDERLALQRERLLAEFFRIESVVAKMQENLSALSALQIIPPLTSSLSNRS